MQLIKLILQSHFTGEVERHKINLQPYPTVNIHSHLYTLLSHLTYVGKLIDSAYSQISLVHVNSLPGTL